MKREEKLALRRRWLAALHQAGHTVIAVAQGHAERVLGLRFGLECTRGIDRDVKRVSALRLERRDFVIRALAGGEAERQLSHAAFIEVWGAGARRDYHDAHRALLEGHTDLQRVAPALVEAYVAEEREEARQAARQLVVRHWHAIERLSEELMNDDGVIERARALDLIFAVDPLLEALPQVITPVRRRYPRASPHRQRP